MSRIRSVHPGLWTGERFMSLSAFARLLIIGIWTEAWDDGVFEWKPLTLKARIFPADNVDVPALLEELLAAGVVRREEVDGRQVGLVRNFREYQRPKKPNESGLLQPEWRTYVGLKSDTSPPVPHQFPTSTEKSPQMEDGGGRMEEKEKSKPPAHSEPGDGARDLFDKVWETFPRNPTSVQAEARRRFDRLKPKDQVAVFAAAERYARWFIEDCSRRKRTVDAGLAFVPHLAKWLDTDAWRHAADLPIKGDEPPPVAMTRLDRLKNPELFRECERIRGKKAPTSDAAWSFPSELVEQARANIETAAA